MFTCTHCHLRLMIASLFILYLKIYDLPPTLRDTFACYSSILDLSIYLLDECLACFD